MLALPVGPTHEKGFVFKNSSSSLSPFKLAINKPTVEDKALKSVYESAENFLGKNEDNSRHWGLSLKPLSLL